MGCINYHYQFAMVDIILGIIVSCLMSIGVYVATTWDASDLFDEDPKQHRIKGYPKHPMLLWWVRWYGSYLPYQFRKPLYFCLPCMGSLWSIPSFVWLDLPLIAFPFFALCTCGLNSLIRYNLDI